MAFTSTAAFALPAEEAREAYPIEDIQSEQ